MSLLKKSKLSGYYLRYVSYGYILKNTEAVKLIEALRDL